uniref:Uncharacterized protein n=1 Tax=Oryza rufipogon TaxID=4529 RepID=A0A0E0NG82_ORYRU
MRGSSGDRRRREVPAATRACALTGVRAYAVTANPARGEEETRGHGATHDADARVVPGRTGAGNPNVRHPPPPRLNLTPTTAGARREERRPA